MGRWRLEVEEDVWRDSKRWLIAKRFYETAGKVGTLHDGLLNKKREAKNNRGFWKGNFWRIWIEICDAATVDFTGFPFLGSVTAESLQNILVCSSRLPPDLLLLPKNATKNPRRCSPEVVSGGIPFALSPRLFAHRAQPTRPLVRKYWEWNRPSIFTAAESLSSTSCQERDNTGR